MRFALGLMLGGGIGYASCWLVYRRAVDDWHREQDAKNQRLQRLNDLQVRALRDELDALRAAGF